MKRTKVLMVMALAGALAQGCAATADDPTGEGGGIMVLPPPTSAPPSTTPPPTAVPPRTTTPPPTTTTPPPTTVTPTPVAGAGGTTPVAVTPMAGAGGAVMMAGAAAPTPPGSATPEIPMLTAECPNFGAGSITFMGLGGITVDAGPKGASPTAPMVFYWHGTGSFAGEYVGMAGAVAAGVKAEGGILISFQGTTGGDFLSGTSIFGAGDFELADQLLACAVQNHNVDPRRVFATGCSAGGLFSTAMAAMRSQYIAAAAPNSGGLTIPVQFSSMYTPPLMTIHGAAGRDVVIIDFSNSSKTADDAFKNRGGFVINCDHGGGHCGGGGLAGSIWEFFKAHPYGVDPEPWTALPAGFHSSCKIY
jgi:hypothetical protein